MPSTTPPPTANELEAARERFYILHKGHVGNSLVWWRQGRCGYTTKLDEALVVERAEAQRICQVRPGEDSMWPVSVIDEVASRQVDCQDLFETGGKEAGS